MISWPKELKPKLRHKRSLGRGFMRRLLKFLHTMGAIGMLGSMACLLVLSNIATPAFLTEYTAVRGAMAAIAKLIFMPSLTLTLIAGLLAVAVSRAFQDAGWAWAKLVSGVLLFEYGLIGIEGPMRLEAERSAAALAGKGDPVTLAASLGAERSTLWILAAVATANVLLGVWRPRLMRLLFCRQPPNTPAALAPSHSREPASVREHSFRGKVSHLDPTTKA